MSDILKRLRDYNPPDRTIDEQKQIAIDIYDAANEIERLRAETNCKHEVGTFLVSDTMPNAEQLKAMNTDLFYFSRDQIDLIKNKTYVVVCKKCGKVFSGDVKSESQINP